MARRVLTQKAMQNSRKHISFCYLCGKELHPGSKKVASQGLADEHVVPRALLAAPPQSAADRWSVVLTVHKRCDEEQKHQVDSQLKILQEMHVRPAADWPDFGHIRGMGVTPGILANIPTRTGLPALSGIGEILDGVGAWVRGFHAALYTCYLPETAERFLLPPVPACNTNGAGPDISETETLSAMTRSVLNLAIDKNKWDGIVAWGGAVDFKCVWWRELSPQGRWVCFWQCSLPGVKEWSGQVLPKGQERPWHGQYRLDNPPAGCSILVAADFPPDEEKVSEPQRGARE